ncbi:hypothetical protein ElyMa_005999700 [Elysia marginata]|uniref:Uncharacterized protein n=1 Tax=Elysia marginata TaxID=1093978 RepID=A0AAV4GH41_9GAST|nr:hypothetical protein ElyMa_005999700 [Elysia marginata]
MDDRNTKSIILQANLMGSMGVLERPQGSHWDGSNPQGPDQPRTIRSAGHLNDDHSSSYAVTVLCQTDHVQETATGVTVMGRGSSRRHKMHRRNYSTH